jgi:histo-blood group ABO system transferase
MTLVTLITVATPGVYRQYANDMMESAAEHFWPSDNVVQRIILPGIEGGWPTSTITRPKVMLNNWNQVKGDYVYCIDADMRFESHVGPEILGELVAVLHPGYFGQHKSAVPYERNPLSKCYVPMGGGDSYFAGGFYGGYRDDMLDLIDAMEWRISADLERLGRIRWNDESALNAALIETPPTTELTPAYCHPDNDAPYLAQWPFPFERKIVALDKDNATRGDRGEQA